MDVALATGLGHLRNAIVAHADAVIAVGGGAGTLAELAFAWIHRRLVVGFRVPGWSGRLAGTRIDDRPRFRSIPDDQVLGVDTAEQAVELLRERLARYRDARRGERPQARGGAAAGPRARRRAAQAPGAFGATCSV